MSDDEKILRLFSFRPRTLSGFQIGREAKLDPQDLYPALSRLERRGALVARWDEGEYPRRRLYSLPATKSQPL